MLKELHLKRVGPAPQFDVELAERLNIFTGDNGLGKTFLLDIVWWILTLNWVEHPAWPHREREVSPEIICHLSNQKEKEAYRSRFDFSEQKWLSQQMPPQFRGLVIYARVNGGFSVFDPARQRHSAYNFTPDTLWNGYRLEGKVLCNGLLQDWVNWQRQPDQSTFQLLSSVIQQLAPQPGESMEPGEPTRVSVEDVRDIPTVCLPYGNVPVIYTSAGMKRILGLAYLLVWTWYEHTQASKLLQTDPLNQIVLLIDEVESHLHPRWQRSLLPAILEVMTQLQPTMKVQAFVTTHSPLVLASVEPSFDEQQDRLFLLELQGEAVTLNEFPWTKQGDTVGWLTSEIFGLKQARSTEAEMAIEAAETWMRGESMDAFADNLKTPSQIQQQLERLLPGHDPFWPRWIVTMEAGR
ncbi:MAG: AAA family ATPase [Symploca sp. SIO2E9]|nr:AAA family ATPase [Symploca sp. SIO2E9]